MPTMIIIVLMLINEHVFIPGSTSRAANGAVSQNLGWGWPTRWKDEIQKDGRLIDFESGRPGRKVWSWRACSCKHDLHKVQVSVFIFFCIKHYINCFIDSPAGTDYLFCKFTRWLSLSTTITISIIFITISIIIHPPSDAEPTPWVRVPSPSRSPASTMDPSASLRNKHFWNLSFRNNHGINAMYTCIHKPTKITLVSKDMIRKARQSYESMWG